MTFDLDKPYCNDLQMEARTDIGKIFVSGATGYIGGRLVYELKQRGYEVKALVRAELTTEDERFLGVEIVVGDALDYESLKNSMEGTKIAYYLMHSLLLGPKEFEAAEIKAASNFRRAAEENSIDRIIYLGGLGDKNENLSKHLSSRLKVADELIKGKIPVTVLRAAIIIGSGSASYEIVKNIVKNAPIILLPKWTRTLCQPIGIRDVIKYLVGCMELDETAGKSYDIGCENIYSYEDVLKIAAELLHKKRIYIKFFISAPYLYSYLVSLFTPVPARIIFALIIGGRNNVICQNNDIKEILKFETLTYFEAIVFALNREEQDKIRTRWTDSYPPSHELAIKLHELDIARFTSTYSLLTKKDFSDIYESICKVGGPDGWYHNNWMWRLRGMIDIILLGVGASRGRRSYSTIRINDVIGFWRIEDLKRNERLLLRAEMKLPGKAWLEFKLDKFEEENKLTVSAYFHHKGLFGRIYWYIFLPFHYIIFKKLIKDIESRS
ncbi:SDR family oxidoreductase [Bacteroidota bacterium]